ncbi:1538_t:CDS:2 [Funneliformis mosseae]|uniref:1538_t:CDS:1 n=1 Tax=Funneliformis mosseae TaxID=27381 RepID=A0A9N9HBV1_FUNMO|nr:1538_t:CDS:2 [Funneliformis mosseae]
MRKYRGKILSININNTILRGTQTIGNLDSSIFVAKKYYEEEDNYEEEQELTKDILPDGTKIKKSASFNLFQSDDDDPSEEHENIPSFEETLNSILSSRKKWILPSSKNVSDVITRNVFVNVKTIQKKKNTLPQKVPHYVTNSIGHLYKSNYFD